MCPAAWPDRARILRQITLEGTMEVRMEADSGKQSAYASARAGDDAGLLRIQAASGALFALFLLMHLVNQMIAALGPAAYDGTQRLLRRAYQAPLIEIFLVITPLL